MIDKEFYSANNINITKLTKLVKNKPELIKIIVSYLLMLIYVAKRDWCVPLRFI